MVRNFDDPFQEWRRLCAEVFGTFFLVLVAAGGPMIDHSIPGSVGRAAAVVAPGLMVMAIILFMGKVSGAHLNPAVTLAFSLRERLPVATGAGLRRGPGGRGLAAAWFLQAVVDVSAHYGSNYPASGSRRHRLPDGGRPDPRSGQRHPRHRVRAQQVGLFGAIGSAATSPWPACGPAPSPGPR